MKCINCSGPALPSNQLCQTCQTLYDLGMISLPSPNPNLLKDEDFGYDLPAAPTLSINSETLSDPALIPTESNHTESNPTESNPKVDISSLFIPSGILTPTLSETVEGMLNPLLLNKIVTEQDETLFQRQKEVENLQTKSIVINRPKFLIEMDGALTDDEIQHLAALDAQEQNSIMNVYKMIDEQCTNEGLGSIDRYHRKEDYLSTMIASFKKKQAEFRQLEMTHVRKRNRLRYEETEKLTPEEREECERRARSSNPDAIRKKELKAAEKKELKVSDFLMKTAMRRVKLGVSKNIEEALEFVTKELGE